MSYRSLHGATGYLSVGLTPVQLTANLVGTGTPAFTAGSKYAAHTIKIQQVESNTGYLCLAYVDRSSGQTTSDINFSTGVCILDKLIPPFTASGSITGLAWLAFTIPYAPGGLNASDYYLISDVASQKAIVSAMRA
jgi:hypothetical protein